MVRRATLAAVLGLSILGLGTTDAGAGASGYGGKGEKNIVQVARDAGSFNTLIKALKATLNGQSLTITANGAPKVGDASITATDIAARIGVIHVIDTVLLPR